ncbi:Cytochrome P450 6a2 [Blattella germanica]|nr:Cytochrome P450 6a2 [Blattella germanica]
MEAMDLITYTIYFLSGFLCFLGILKIFMKKSFLYWKKRDVPYLEPSFPFGNLKGFLTFKRSMGEAYADIYRKLGDVPMGGAFMVHRPVLILKDPELIRNFLVKDFEHFHDHGFVFDEKVDPLAGNLFMLNGKKWKGLRNDLTRTFTSGKIKRMFNMAVACGEELAEFLKKPGNRGDVVEVKDIMAKFTIDIIASCAFGVQCNSLKNPDCEFRRYGKRMQELSLLDHFRGLLYMVAPSVAISLKLPITPSCVSAFFRKVVKEIIDVRKRDEIKRNDFIQLLLELKEEKIFGESKSGLTMDQITAQVMIFFTGGFETSSNVMSFCLYELAMNLDIQGKLRQEITSVLEKHGSVTYEAVNEMKYLNQVISESLRKYPPVSLLNRDCNKPYKIPGTDYTVEKGTQVVVPVLGLHKDATYYPDPEKFDPERFSNEEIFKRHHYVYLPFGEGPRICIGMRFGLMQTKVGLIHLLQNFEFHTCDETVIPPTINPRLFITSAVGGIHLQIKSLRQSNGGNQDLYVSPQSCFS